MDLEPTPAHQPRTDARARERARKSLCHMGLGPWN